MPNTIKPRDVVAYTDAWLAKLPLGAVWPRDPDSTLYKAALGLNDLFARFATRAAYFVNVEAYPPTALELLKAWERVLGLPGKCIAAAYASFTIAERQQAVREKLARRPGRQDRYYMLERAAAIGYQITITEYAMAMAGVCRAGANDTTEAGGQLIVRRSICGDPAYRFVWRVEITGPRLTWFRAGAGGGRAGEDPHLSIARATDLECILEDVKPAHTKLIFSYTGI